MDNANRIDADSTQQQDTSSHRTSEGKRRQRQHDSSATLQHKLFFMILFTMICSIYKSQTMTSSYFHSLIIADQSQFKPTIITKTRRRALTEEISHRIAESQQLQQQNKESKQTRRRNQNNRKRIHDFVPNVPLPIFLASLPKSGTTNTHKYLGCEGRIRSRHQWTNAKNGSQLMKIGECMQENIQASLPPWQDCGNADAWTDTGIVQKDGTCFYPTVHLNALEHIYQAYPVSTIILMVRNSTAWAKSAAKYNNLRFRWARNCEGFPNVGSTTGQWASFYEAHTESIRQFAHNHPSMTYLEYSLEANDTSTRMQDDIGIPATCWKPSYEEELPMSERRRRHRRHRHRNETTTVEAAVSRNITAAGAVSHS